MKSLRFPAQSFYQSKTIHSWTSQKSQLKLSQSLKTQRRSPREKNQQKSLQQSKQSPKKLHHPKDPKTSSPPSLRIGLASSEIGEERESKPLFTFWINQSPLKISKTQFQETTMSTEKKGNSNLHCQLKSSKFFISFLITKVFMIAIKAKRLLSSL